MSTKITTQVWALRGIPSTTKLIIIKLADNANDDGVCWPSIQKIADECEVGVRTVQGAVIWAEKHGLIQRDLRAGKKTVYTLTPAGFAPPQDLRPADYDVQPPQITAQTPADYDTTPAEYCGAYREPSIEPSREPSVEPSNGNSVKPDVNETLQRAVEDWNQMARDLGLAEVQKLTDARKSKLRARLRDCGGLDGWAAALAKIRGSPFLRGEKTGWKADFDFVLQEKSFTKLMEGGYPDDSHFARTSRDSDQSRLTPAERVVAAANGWSGLS